jgi:hypothetical protein
LPQQRATWCRDGAREPPDHRRGEAEQDETRQGAGDETGPEPAVERGSHRKTRKRRHRDERGQRDIRARPGPRRRDQRPEKRRRRNIPRPRDRPEREREGDEDAIDRREAESRGIDATRDTDAERARHEGRGDQRDRCADRKPECDPERRHGHHLDEIGGEDEPAGRADAFQRRDGRDPAFYEAAHGVGDPDAADQKGCQADEREEHRDAIDPALKARRRVGDRPDPPARRRKPGLEIGQEPL